MLLTGGQKLAQPAGWWSAAADGVLRRSEAGGGLVEALRLEGFRARQVGTTILGSLIVVPLEHRDTGRLTAVRTLCVGLGEFAHDLAAEATA